MRRRSATMACLAAMLVSSSACDSPVAPVEPPAPPPPHVWMETVSSRVWVNTHLKLTATVEARDGTLLDASMVKWSASDSTIVAIRERNGEVRAFGLRPGSATVRAHYGDGQASTTLTVETGGEMHLVYSGARNGELIASGLPPENSGGQPPAYVRAYREWDQDRLVLFGGQLREDGSFDWFQVEMPFVAQRRDWQFPVNCAGGTTVCVQWVGLVFNSSTQYNAWFGYVRVIELTGTRVIAELDGAFCHWRSIGRLGTTCTPDPDNPLLHIKGTFDMPITDGVRDW